MSKFRWMRWIVWAALSCVLVVLGVGIYQAQPHQPRWQTAKRILDSGERASSIREVRFSRDGTKVITFAVSLEMAAALTMQVPEVPKAGTVDVWDRDTGQLTRYPGTGQFLDVPVFSRDMRYCAGEAAIPTEEWRGRKYAITIVDLDEGRQIDFPLNHAGDGGLLAFSPTGEILVHLPAFIDGPALLRVFESATGKLLDQRQSFGLFGADRRGDAPFEAYPFSDDHLFHYLDAELTTAERWSLATRKTTDTFYKPGLMIGGLSRDRRALILYRPEGQDKHPFARWDLASREFTVGPAVKYQGSDFPASPDGKWVSDTEREPGRCHLIDIATGESRGSTEHFFGTHWTDFSPDGRHLAAHYQTPLYVMPGRPLLPPGAPDALKVYAVPSMKLLWKARLGDCHSIAYSQDSGTIYASFESEHAIGLFAMETGNPLGAIDMPCLGQTNFSSASDGRYLVILRWDNGLGALGPRSLPERVIEWIASFVRPPHRTNATTVVYDTVTNSERFRLTGLHFDNVWLSDDGATLITAHDEGGGSVLRCWDVGWKPLRSPVGIPVALGMFAVALAMAYRRLRRKKT